MSSLKDKLDAKLGVKWRRVIDQVMHFLWSFLALIPVLAMNDKMLGGMLSGLLLALPRELIDQWPVGHWKDTLLDLAFFALGGAVIGNIL
jgi:hypothetical protein